MTAEGGESARGSGRTILYVITDLLVGGVPLHLHRLARAMHDRAFVPIVVSLARRGTIADRLESDGFIVHSCDGVSGYDFRVIGRLARIFRSVAPDIIHSFLFHANVAARLAADQVGFDARRVVCEIQTVEVERRWHLVVDRFTHRGCRFMIGNSPSVVEHLACHARIPRDRLRLVRGGIDPDAVRAAQPVPRSTLGLDANAQIVLWAGRLDPVKGLDVLLAAFALAAPKTPAHLLLAGDGPRREALAASIVRMGLSGRVHLLGVRRDVPALLQTADVFAFPSRTEGLPNALLEAMAAGCPIVTTDVPGCRDLIQNRTTGLVVPYHDTSALADALLVLLKNRTLAADLGSRAAATVTNEWHINATHAAYAAIYDEIAP